MSVWATVVLELPASLTPSFLRLVRPAMPWVSVEWFGGGLRAAMWAFRLGDSPRPRQGPRPGPLSALVCGEWASEGVYYAAEHGVGGTMELWYAPAW